jgi:hypothetical protein
METNAKLLLMTTNQSGNQSSQCYDDADMTQNISIDQCPTITVSHFWEHPLQVMTERHQPILI